VIGRLTKRCVRGPVARVMDRRRGIVVTVGDASVRPRRVGSVARTRYVVTRRRVVCPFERLTRVNQVFAVTTRSQWSRPTKNTARFQYPFFFFCFFRKLRTIFFTVTAKKNWPKIFDFNVHRLVTFYLFFEFRCYIFIPLFRFGVCHR